MSPKSIPSFYRTSIEDKNITYRCNFSKFGSLGAIYTKKKSSYDITEMRRL